MSERIPCSEYDAEKVRCLSGFPILHSVCHGAPPRVSDLRRARHRPYVHA